MIITTIQSLYCYKLLINPFTYSQMGLSPVCQNPYPNLHHSPQPPTQSHSSLLSVDNCTYFQWPGHLPEHLAQALLITLSLSKKNKQTYLCPQPSLPSILQSQMMSCPSSCLRLTLPNDLDPSPPTSSRTLLHQVYALGQVISSL